MDGSLDGVRDAVESISELIFYVAQPSIQESGVCQDQLEQHPLEFIEAILETHEALGEVLNDLKEMPSGLTVLEQLRVQVFIQGPIE